MAPSLDDYSWEQWSAMPEPHRARIVSELDPSRPGGAHLLPRVLDEFRGQYSHTPGINDIGNTGNYHGQLVIDVQVQWPADPILPESFFGLRVMKFYTWAPKDLIAKLGEDWNEYSYLFDKHHASIERDLGAQGFTIETAPRDIVLQAILKHRP